MENVESFNHHRYRSVDQALFSAVLPFSAFVTQTGAAAVASLLVFIKERVTLFDLFATAELLIYFSKVGQTYGTTGRILRRKIKLKAYKTQLGQELKPLNFPEHHHFAIWVLEKFQGDPPFSGQIMFSDDAHYLAQCICKQAKFAAFPTKSHLKKFKSSHIIQK